MTESTQYRIGGHRKCCVIENKTQAEIKLSFFFSLKKRRIQPFVDYYKKIKKNQLGLY